MPRPTSHVASYRLDVDLWSHEQGARRLSPHVFDFTTVKGISSPAGQWSCTFDAKAAGIDPFDIEDDDWIGIGVRDVLAKSSNLLMFGQVDGSRSGIKTSTDSGTNTTTGRLNGRDFAKGFESHEVLFDSFLQLAEPILPGVVDYKKFHALVDLVQTGQLQNPAATLAQLLTVLLLQDTGWLYFPESFGPRSLDAVLGLEANIREGNVIQLGSYVPERSQKLDPYLRSIFLTPLNELWYDLRPLSTEAFTTERGQKAGDYFRSYGMVPTIVYRDCPFFELDETSDLWFSLVRHTVHESEVMDEDLGRSGAERFTLFSARGPAWSADTLATWSASGGRIPAFEHQKSDRSPIAGRRLSMDVAKHGVRLLEINDALAPLVPTAEGEGRGVAIEWLVNRTAALYQLYRNSPATLSGSLKIAQLRPGIRAGEVVRYKGHEFYVEQVQHSGRVDPATGLLVGETALSLIRGQRIGETAATAPRPWRIGRPK